MTVMQLLNWGGGSSLKRWVMNQILWYVVPFNRPHAIKVTAVSEDGVHLKLPLIRKNSNHLKTLHACALATACEYATGLHLIRFLDTKKYRIILVEIRMEYLKQGRSDGYINFSAERNTINDITNLLQSESAVIRTFETGVVNQKGDLLCKAFITWQIKKWTAVKSASI